MANKEIGELTAAIALEGGETLHAVQVGNSRKVTVDQLANYFTPTSTVLFLARSTAPSGWIKANGAAVLRASYSDLDAAIYCGDINNATADWGYRATTDVDLSANRSTTGDYIVIPDLRGEFPRGWDDGRSVDSGRSLWATQLDAMQRLTGEGTSSWAHISGQAGTGVFSGGSATASRISPAGLSGAAIAFDSGDSPGARVSDVETRSRNIALLACIKY